MVSIVIPWIGYHILLPITLLASIVFRYNVFSSLYLVLLLAYPYMSTLTHATKGRCGAYVLGNLATSLVFILAQVSFQAALLASPPYGSLAGDQCSDKEKILRHIGLERLDLMPVSDVFRFLLPDVLVFIIAALTYVLLKKITPPSHDQQPIHLQNESENLQADLSTDELTQSGESGTILPRVTSTAVKNGAMLFITMIGMALAGIANPSVFSASYLLTFMVLMTAWSLHGRMLGNGVVAVRVVVSFIAAIQLLLLYYYQIEFFRDAYPNTELGARLMGLTPFVNTSCETQAYHLVLNTGISWTEFVSPPLTFVMYLTLAFGVKIFLTSDKAKMRSDRSPRRQKRRKDERMPLVHNVEIPQSYDTINAPSTSAAVGVDTQEQEDSSSPAKPGFLQVIVDWLSGLKMQSFYVAALVVMMAWSVTFHSWLTLVLLVWSCVIWLVENRSWWTLCSSPAFTIYAMLLISLQYLYSLNLTEAELPTVVTRADDSKFNLSSFGIMHYYDNNPSLYLGAQILYMFIFWIVLHQFVYIRKHREQIGSYARDETSWMVQTSFYIKEKLSKYWILVVYGFVLAICTEGRPSAIKMVYALMLAISGLVFEVSWGFWCHTLSIFLMTLVCYTMIVVLLIYTYQFDNFPGYWKSFTNFTDQELADLGLIKYDQTGQLLLHIFIPTLLLLTVIFQKHYFHKKFLELIKLRVKVIEDDEGGNNEQPGPMSEQAGSQESIELQDLSKKDTEKQVIRHAKRAWEIILCYWYGLIRLLWRLLEFHMWKLLIITVLVSALQKASLLYAILFVIWVASIPLRSIRLLLYILTSAYIGLVFVASMFYQLDFINEIRGNDLYYNCSFLLDANTSWTHDYDLVEWIGFSKMSQGGSFFYHAQGYISIIIMLAFERVVVRRQEWRSVYRREIKLPSQLAALYPSITHKEVDNDFVSCCKYFINYWFYKFGVEACYVMSVVTIWVRADSFAVVYSVFFIIALVLKTRRNLSRYWQFYVILLLTILIGEYAIALGMPPVWCLDNEYPWTTFDETAIETRNRLIRWLYLPDYIVPPESTSLIVDVFQLLFIVCQLYVFKFEQTAVASDHGGDNKYLTSQQLDEVTPNSNMRPNFKSKNSRNILDQFKVVIFQYSFWVTCAIIFIAGTSRISLFCMGYLFAFFYLLTFQQQLLMGKPSRLLKVFNMVLGYNVAVIVMKIWLQIASCVYIDALQKEACIFVQLFSLMCAKPGAYDGLIEQMGQSECETPDSYTNAGLTWDFVCFLFLIIQRRIFRTYYFLHVSEDMRISMKLASRGAEMFEEKLILEVNNRITMEENGVAQIRENLTSIKDKYSKIEIGATTHSEVMRSGDYYMFEEDDEKAGVEKPKDILNPLQMLHMADTAGIDKALEEREDDKKMLEEGDDRSPVPKETFFGRSTEDLTAIDEQEVEPKKRSVILKGLVFLWELFLSGIDTLILWLNTRNRDYRNIALQLADEKDELLRSHLAQLLRPSSTEIVIEPAESSAAAAAAADSSKVVSKKGEEEDDTPSSGQSSAASPKSELEPMDFDKDQLRVFRLFYAIWYSIIARTDLVCYFLIILNLILTASVMSLILPLAIFLWSTLSTPRPTSRFWNFCIVYLEIVILIKFLFQFEFFSWNDDAVSNLQINNPFWPPRLIGVEQKQSWGVLDLMQLLAIFFHRLTLKVHGLWNKVSKPVGSEESSQDNETEVQKSIVEGNADQTKEEPSMSKDGQAATKSKGASGEEDGGQKPSILERLKKVATSPCRFYKRILNQEFTTVTDVYILIFLCDAINFIIIIFGYWAFGKYATEATDVVSNFSANKVPTGFLVMLLIQFGMMFIDRALYLRKNLVGKMIFQVSLVIGIHIWMFFVIPAINERPFYMNHIVQTWYFFKAIYFLLSAYQIRCGYPKRVLGNFLTKAYGTANLFLYKGYRMIPFLVELTAVMDWMFVGTTMGIGEWFKFQSIYAEVFELKCWRVFETNYPSPRGQAKSKFVKYFVGGLLVLFLVAIIWFPLLFMNIVMTVAGITNNPVRASIQITANAFEPLFQVVADSESISVWDESRFKDFARQHADDATAAMFLSTFSPSQVVSIRIDGESKTTWAISPPQRAKLLSKLSNASSIPVQLDFEWRLIRDSERTSVVTTTGYNQLELESNDSARAQLYDLLETPGVVKAPATITNLYPKYIYASAGSTSSVANRLNSQNKTALFADTDLSLRYSESDDLISWWRVSESTTTVNTTKDVSLEIVVFSDKVSPASLSFLASYGIIGLYVSVVLVVGNLVRSALIGSTSTIMFQELPRADRILQLCLDIYFVREEQEFQLEEELYAKLIFLYRSPQTLIQWSRPKQD